ncbi:MAG TPA: hypothetical protein PKW15_08570, partial [Alphaproteobacteria bacterium]|nr:hypothetical protein [Alphaproteobacteria bacterium]
DEEFLSLPKLAPRSFVILASDFRQSTAYWKKIISEISEMGAGGICIQMLDPIEDEFPLYGRVRLESAEDDSTMVIPGADMVRPIYLQRLREQKDMMKDLCLQYNWQWINLNTDITPRKQLSQILQILVRR